MMNTKNIFRGLITILWLAFAVSSCESYNEELLDGIGNTREFSPIGLTAKIRNSTTVELDWGVKADENPDHYVVEFSADDPEFKTIFKTINVTPSQLPVQVALEGETTYSIRVKSVSAAGLEDSKWSITTATTLSEQIFFPIKDEEIQATSVTLRWTPNSNVTHILLQPGNLNHTITAEEKVAGVAVVTGLTPETNYDVTLKNGTKTRGTLQFTSGVDLTNGIIVNPGDDLNAKIAQASAGSRLLLMPGNFQTTGEVILNKTLIIRGVRPENRPILNVKFTINSGLVNLSLMDLELKGTGLNNAAVVTVSGASSNYGDILITRCAIHDYTRALIAANASNSKVASFTVDNSIVKSVNTNAGADFIDFRNSHVASIVLKNSTFDSCSTSRDFVRVDGVVPANGGFSGTGLKTTILIQNCTLYNVSNLTAPKRILYVRFLDNSSTVMNTLIVSTSAIYTNHAATETPAFSKNYYYTAESFMDATIPLNKVDATGVTANPQFVDAATGNFKVQNQSMIDNNIGDPRWLK
ncbi:MAG: DUF4957 domain-containing protein [Flavobacterium nitrogenifigens]|uniref:DUF5123 domain-containing protein n=1 Tax=Flavobacterium nitrogenifigens TaxID=1617283 RepID=UPI0028078DD5|nr:DUF5123 domain-containing protein [Flavobacterium nitrogenifigens]MDQ8012358.1 DUF4957 domain-containing protein [Flavobacterium nitrogenifigens]